MDFVSFNRDKHGYDNILIIINYLLKKSIFIFCCKIITIKKIVLLFIYYIWRYFRSLDFIVLDRGPQFISDFWAKFC
jgi:hypothetical protein